MKKIFLITLSVVIASTLSGEALANVAEDLKAQIAERAKEIEEIENEIKKYQEELDALGEEKSSLQKEIRTITLTQKKLSADIRATERKIAAKSLEIEKLRVDIKDKEKDIGEKTEIIKRAIRRINELEENSLAEMVLSGNSVSEMWDDIENFRRVREGMEREVVRLRALKEKLGKDKEEIESARDALVALRSRLSDQKKIADGNKREKSRLLSRTKNQEALYQKQLREKLRLKEEFEKALFDLESRLKAVIDPGSLPPARKGVFSLPLDNMSLKSCYGKNAPKGKRCVTQYFGNTPFAKSGAYNGRGHNGMDFRASVGTEVYAVLPGTVVETGNTDSIPGCYSYGKWILVRHNNGLSTLYAHLSYRKVKAGDTVAAGQTIGYSGNTGYSTGPHLHLTAYATQGVKVVRLGDIKKRTNCANARIPVAPLNAYLNPLDYL